MNDFLFELRSEEMPARMQAKARNDLTRLFTDAVAKAGLSVGAVETFSTPRRLTLIARDVPDATQPTRVERKGPRAAAPEAALSGFLRSTGLAREQLVERDGVLFALIDTPGRAATAVLAEAIPAIVRGFPWPKSMRWGRASDTMAALRWVRPLQGIVALLGEAIVDCEIDGIVSGAATVGHRFHHGGAITIGSAADYAQKLRACYVIVDHAEREAIVRDQARTAASEAGLVLVEDEGLVVENAALTEWPVPLLGRFDAAFLGVPREVIQLTMRTNQKYFACVDQDGALANAFVCVANLASSDPGAVIAGNERVLSARLADARFFWDNDLRVPLADQAAKLAGIVFHEQLGTVADKVDRVAKLARWLCEEGIVDADPALAEQAALLCKADLVSGMVGEFPELQGVIGGYLALAQGLDAQVADAIRDHYKPVGQGDDVPTAPVTVAVSLADKLDTLCSFFAIHELPTGSRDPFALRRAALGVLKLDQGNQLQIDLDAVCGAWAGNHNENDVSLSLMSNFVIDRLMVQQRELGIRPDLVSASENWGTALDGRPNRILRRAHALQAFVETAEGANLLAGYKRAANILKKEGVSPSPSGGRDRREAPGRGNARDVPSPCLAAPSGPSPLQGEGSEEKALVDALDRMEPTVAAAIAAEDFAAAMSALSALRAPIDAFFDHVTVNDADPVIRARRLALLARFRDAVHGIADFSKIEG